VRQCRAMGAIVNEFSWSRSRDNTFQDCRRKYFYHYYGSWVGGTRRPPTTSAGLRPQAARVAPDVGGAGRARRDRDGLPRLRRRPRPPERAVHRRLVERMRATGAPPGRPLPREPQDGGALRARVRRRSETRSVAGALPQRRGVPAQLLPPPAPGGDPQDADRSLVDRALVQGFRVRGHAVWVARTSASGRRGAARAGGLEDRRATRRAPRSSWVVTRSMPRRCSAWRRRRSICTRPTCASPR